MIEWLIRNPFVFGFITFLLMWIDWLLTIAQEKERKEHYFKHYQSYPINTIEGSPAFQHGVAKQQLINKKHFISSIIIGSAVSFALMLIPLAFSELFIGYVWGLFIIVLCHKKKTKNTWLFKILFRYLPKYLNVNNELFI